MVKICGVHARRRRARRGRGRAPTARPQLLPAEPALRRRPRRRRAIAAGVAAAGAGGRRVRRRRAGRGRRRRSTPSGSAACSSTATSRREYCRGFAVPAIKALRVASLASELAARRRAVSTPTSCCSTPSPGRAHGGTGRALDPAPAAGVPPGGCSSPAGCGPTPSPTSCAGCGRSRSTSRSGVERAPGSQGP